MDDWVFQGGEMTEQQFFEYFRGFVDSLKSKTEAARRLGITKVYVGDMYHGRRAISNAVAEKLGYRRKVQIEKITTFDRMRK